MKPILYEDEQGRVHATFVYEPYELLRDSGLPVIVQGIYTLENFTGEQGQEIKAHVVKYLNKLLNAKPGEQPSLLLTGRPGTGKTHLAAGAFIKALEHEMPGKYMNYAAGITKLKQNVIDPERYEDIIYPLQTCSLLFIDDLFKGEPTKADIKHIYNIINERYANHRPIIITSERGSRELYEIDRAIAGRIMEMAQGFTISTNSLPDYRIIKARQEHTK